MGSRNKGASAETSVWEAVKSGKGGGAQGGGGAGREWLWGIPTTDHTNVSLEAAIWGVFMCWGGSVRFQTVEQEKSRGWVRNRTIPLQDWWLWLHPIEKKKKEKAEHCPRLCLLTLPGCDHVRSLSHTQATPVDGESTYKCQILTM